MHLPCGSPALASDLPRTCLAWPSPRSGLSPRTYHAFTMRAPRAGHTLTMQRTTHVPCGSAAACLPCIYDAARRSSPLSNHALPCDRLAPAARLPCIYHAARRPSHRIYLAFTMRLAGPRLGFTMHLRCLRRSGQSPRTYHAFTMWSPRAGRTSTMHLPCGSLAPGSDLPCVYHASGRLGALNYHAFTMRFAGSTLGCTRRLPCDRLAPAIDEPCIYSLRLAGLRLSSTMHLPCGSPALALDLPCARLALALPWPAASDIPYICHAVAQHRPYIYLPCIYHAARRPWPRIYNAFTMRLSGPRLGSTTHLPCDRLAPGIHLPCTYHAARRLRQ